MCFNIRSANANVDELLLCLENDVNSKNIDIVIVTETWYDTNHINISLSGYSSYFTEIKRNQNDGIIIFFKKHLNLEFL